jgi:mRNA interferase RelE/StbE
MYFEKAEKELAELDKSQRVGIAKKIDEVLKNPLPKTTGARGIPLGNKAGTKLANCLEVKHRGLGLRAIYQLLRSREDMYVFVVSKREDNEAYKIAEKRLPEAEADYNRKIEAEDKTAPPKENELQGEPELDDDDFEIE